MHEPDKNCPELTQETASAIDNSTLYQLFVSTQMNNLDLCVQSALQWESCIKQSFTNWKYSDTSWKMAWDLIGM